MCATLVQAVVLWFACLFILVFFRTLLEGRASEYLVRGGQNAVAILLGAQTAVVCFRWRVLHEQDESN
jgi:hypothetical protein